MNFDFNGLMFTWQRAQTSASWDRMSLSLPFPSSPHWAPRTTVTPLVDMPAVLDEDMIVKDMMGEVKNQE